MSSLIRKNVLAMSGYVPGEQPKVPGLVKLNTNENPYPPSDRIAAFLQGVDPCRLRLYPDPSCTRLKEAIARLHGCEAENVFAGNGSDEVLAVCTRAFVEDDGCIGYFEPSYSLYPVLSEIRNAKARPVELGERFSWRMDDGYEADLFFLTNPNAPTSLQYDREDIKRFCAGSRGVVVIDEAYVDFASYDCVDLALGMPNVLVARTFSKSYSLAGLRAGYALGSAGLVEAMNKIKDSYNLDMLAQEIARIAVEDPEHMRMNAARIKKTRGRMAAGLEQMGFHVYDSQTNFLWVECGEEKAVRMFEALRAGNVLVRYFPGPRTGSFLRVTVGTDEQAEMFLKVLGGALK